jgi:hypothetical protein
MDLVPEEPNAWKSATEKTHFYYTGKEEFMYQTSRVHQSTKRIYTYPTWTRKESCKCQITQYSYMQNIITHTLIRATVVSTCGRARMSWLLDMSLFTVLTSQNEKMRRNRSIRTTSVRVVIPIIWYVVNNKELKTLHMSYENFITKIHKPIIRQMRIDINNCKLDLACLTKHSHDKYQQEMYQIVNHVSND